MVQRVQERWRGWMPWQRRLAVAGGAAAAVFSALAVTVAVAGPLFWYPCSLDGLEPHGQGEVSYVYSAGGKPLGVIAASRNRAPVSFDRISPVMRAAIVSIEDRRFYEHGGVDYRAVLRALTSDVGSGQASQGGSTLSQQLVRNLYLSDRRTFSRKLTEACLAVKLDRKWGKQRVLTAYLNQIYFGHRAYGVEAAARAFFGTHASRLTLDQAALLAGMPQSPSGYDPFTRPQAALRRRAEVLRAMRETGAITAERERQARAAPFALHPGKAYSSTHESYLTEYISNRLLELYGPERVRRGGLRIYTTLSARMQHTAEAAITAVLDRRGDPAGALVSLDPKTGAIRAMAVAQTGHRLSFNIAANGRRQAGSTFKMFVLTEAIRRGINPWATKYLSAPFTGPHDWKVQTYEHTYSGRIPISQATLASDNTVFARLTLDVGPGRIAELASQMGIRSPLQPVPTVGLGANSISPMDLATAYSALASGGVLHTPTLLARVVFPDGVTTQPDKSSSSSVVDPKVAATVTKVLQANVNSGTGTAAALSDRPAAGKTGTTDDYADAWFAGFVPQLSAVVWVGYPDRERPMRDVHGLQVAGGTFPAQIWHGFMERALSGQRPRPFADLGMPAFERWCGRYQFARSTADAKPRNGCPAIEPRAKRKPRKQAPIPTTTAVPTETLPTETTPRQAPPTATHVTTAPATQPSPPPTQTTPPPNTTTYPTEPDATPVVGKEGQVVVDVDADGNGVVRVANRYYRAENADDPQQTMPAGTAVTVVDANGDVADVRAAS